MLADLVKNAAAPVVLPWRRNRGCFGLDGDPVAAAQALERLAPSLAATGRSVTGLRTLELGPGRTPELMAGLLLAGAENAIGVDTDIQVPSDSGDAARYATLLRELSRDPASFLRAMGSDPGKAQDRYEALRKQPLPLSFRQGNGTSISLTDHSVDLVISKSVFEHIRLRRIDHVLSELKRVLAPGGHMVHAIDLRDHLHLVGDEDVRGDWLTALRYPQWLFDAMFSQRSTYINRLRSPQWRSRFENAGFDIVDWRTQSFPLPPGFDPGRLLPPWDGFSRETLTVGFLYVAARLPG